MTSPPSRSTHAGTGNAAHDPPQHDGPRYDGPQTGPRKHRLRRELIIAGSCLAVGLILLPALIYAFGVNVLGAYGGGPHIGSFYGDYFRNLAGGTFRTWLLVLGPYLLAWTLRLIFRAPAGPASPSAPPAPVAETAAPSGRREPFISS